MNNIGKIKVINIITKALHAELERVTPSTTLTNRLQIDDLDLAHICSEIEKEFGIDINNKTSQHFYKVNDFISAIDKSLEPYQKG